MYVVVSNSSLKNLLNKNKRKAYKYSTSKMITITQYYSKSLITTPSRGSLLNHLYNQLKLEREMMMVVVIMKPSKNMVDITKKGASGIN